MAIFLKKCFLLLMFFALSGCATIMHGTKQNVPVTTDPPGATVTDGTVSKQTPTTFELKRDHDYVLTISKVGYNTEIVTLHHVISGDAAANIIGPGLIGVAIDVADGAAWTLEPETIVITLRPVKEGELIYEINRLTMETLDVTLNTLMTLRMDNIITEEEYQAMVKVILLCVEES